MKHLVLIALIAAAGFLFLNDSRAAIESPNKDLLNKYNNYLS